MDVVTPLRSYTSLRPPPATPPPLCERPRCGKLVERRGNPSSDRDWARYCSAFCNNLHQKEKAVEKKKEVRAENPKMVVCQWEKGCTETFQRKGNMRYCQPHREESFRQKASQRSLAYLDRKAKEELGIVDPPKEQEPEPVEVPRVNHTGTQPRATISDSSAPLDGTIKSLNGVVVGLEGLWQALQFMKEDAVRVTVTMLKDGRFHLEAVEFFEESK